MSAKVVLLFLLAAWSAQELSAPPSDPALERFRGILTEEAVEMGQPVPDVVRTADAFGVNSGRPLAIIVLPALLSASPRYLIYAFSGYLDSASALESRHGAVHELCHIKLAHVVSGRSPQDTDELGAERCVYDRVGEDEYIAWVREMSRHDPAWSEVGVMEDDRLRFLIRLMLGVA